MPPPLDSVVDMVCPASGGWGPALRVLAGSGPGGTSFPRSGMAGFWSHPRGGEVGNLFL